MPTPSEILASLSRVANDASSVAVAWHFAIALAFLVLARGFRPSQRTAALLLTLPLLSVSVVAWAFRNPFNGAVLAAAAFVLAVFARRGSPQPIHAGKRWAVLVGSALITFGWVYPHFLVERSPLTYLYAAPLGILPCPTLALVSGSALCAGGVVGGPWRLTLAGVAAFYAVFGLLRLGVLMDSFLLVGAVSLLLQHLARRRVHAPRPLPRSNLI